MNKQDNGGPAFPSSNTPGTGFYAEGMTLRDYFAAKAMASLVSLPTWTDSELDADALLAYKMADAMLAERAR